MSTEPLILDFPDQAAPDATHHLVRAELTSRRPKQLHGHRFYELLWVQNGILRHHSPQGVDPLSEGAILFIRPGDMHGLQGKGEASMVVSLSIRTDLIEAIGARNPALKGKGFWSSSDRPVCIHRDARQMAALNHAALRLERGARTALSLEAFLLPLAMELAEDDTGLGTGAPLWLERACVAAQDPNVFRDGAAGLVAAAGKAHPHVARSMRQYSGMTPSDYVNALRMRFAARRLTGSEDTLTEIAIDCGLPNLSHFHKLFLAHHGQTPQRYRRAHRQDLIQP